MHLKHWYIIRHVPKPRNLGGTCPPPCLPLWHMPAYTTKIFFEIPPCAKIVIFVTEFVILYKRPPFYEGKWIIRKWLLSHGGISIIFLIARLARSDPRNSFVARLLCAFYLNFALFHHVFISSLDMFKNCINSYHIESKQV